MQGRLTGLNEVGNIVCEIPNSIYIGYANYSKSVFILDAPMSRYDIAVYADTDGIYDFIVEWNNGTCNSAIGYHQEIVADQVQRFTADTSSGEILVHSWESQFEDSRRQTILRISTDDGYFQFIAPDKDFGIKHDPRMVTVFSVIIINYKDSSMQLIAIGSDGILSFCTATARDKQTGKQYLLIQKPVLRCHPRENLTP